MNIRFLLSAHIAPLIYEAQVTRPNEDADYKFSESFDSRVTRLQFRALGQIPFIDNSFFLVSSRLEDIPRITFALFQIPLWKDGYFNINAGGSALSHTLILSSTKQSLLSAPYGLFTPFEQRMNLGMQVGSFLDPLKKWHANFLAAGGMGKTGGNIGNNYYPKDLKRFTFLVGGRMHYNPLGHYSYWDSQFLYKEQPLTLSLKIAGKFEHREYEKSLVFTPQIHFRWWVFSFDAEAYVKREFDFESWQMMYHLQLGILLWPEHFMLAADIGQLWLGKPEKIFSKPAQGFFESEKLRNTLEFRAALHWYFWKNIGIASILYSEQADNPSELLPNAKQSRTSEVRVEMQFRI